MENNSTSELESLGIFRSNKVPKGLEWMSTETKQLMMDLLLAGAEGISIKTLTKYRQTFEAEFVRLEMAMLMQWMPDRTGKPVAVSLTWKGEEAAALLREFAIKETRKFSYS